MKTEQNTDNARVVKERDPFDLPNLTPPAPTHVKSLLSSGRRAESIKRAQEIEAAEEEEQINTLAAEEEEEKERLRKEAQYIPGNDSSLPPAQIARIYADATEILMRLFLTPTEYMGAVPAQQVVRITGQQFSVLKELSRISGRPINMILINLLNEILKPTGGLSLNKEIVSYMEKASKEKAKTIANMLTK